MSFRVIIISNDEPQEIDGKQFVSVLLSENMGYMDAVDRAIKLQAEHTERNEPFTVKVMQTTMISTGEA